MTATGRAVVAVVALVMGAVLVIIGALEHDSGSTTAGVAIVGPVLGYAFGDRNGERRLASALTILQAERITAQAEGFSQAPALRKSEPVAAPDAT